MTSPLPHLVLTRAARESGTITDIQITAVGHFPRRLAPGTDATFDHHSLVLLAAGYGRYRVTPEVFATVGPGSMWCINPGHPYRYSPDPDGWWEEFFIDIAGPGIERWIQRGWWSRSPELFRLAPIGPLVSHISELMHVLSQGTAASADRAVLMTESLLLDMYHARSRVLVEDVDPGQPAIAGVLSYLHQRYAEAIDFDKLAAHFAISPTSLRRGIARLTGEPPAAYLRRLRCDIATKLLTETAMPIQEIARSVGIPSSVVFARIFQRHMGVNPSRFRKADGTGDGRPRSA